MVHALLALPHHLPERLIAGLTTGLLTPPYAAATMRPIVGADRASDVGVTLGRLDQAGVSAPAVVAWMHSVTTAESRVAAPQLVWSGPEVPGLHARDTRRVYHELLGSARRSIWASTFVFFDGPKTFELLARRMDAEPRLRVTLLLNIQRRRGDTTVAELLVRRFADRFWGSEWPGDATPEVYYDPRAIALEGPGGVLHAKAVVADDEAVFITSANLTEAALDRNIEIGLLVRDRPLAANVVRHFRILIDRGMLMALPSR